MKAEKAGSRHREMAMGKHHGGKEVVGPGLHPISSHVMQAMRISVGWTLQVGTEAGEQVDKVGPHSSDRGIKRVMMNGARFLFRNVRRPE
jgi:hypothetical protein